MNEAINSVLVDSVVRVTDTIVSADTLLQPGVSWKPQPPFDTITPYVHLVQGIPQPGAGFEFVSGVLIYTVVFLMVLAWIRFRGHGLISSVFIYFLDKKRGAHLFPEGTRQQHGGFLFLSLCLSFSCLSMLIAFLTTDPLSFPLALVCFAGLFAYHLLLIGFVKLFGWVFDGERCASEMILNTRIWGVVLGVSIAPCVLILFYAGNALVMPMMYVIAGIGGIFVILRFIRLIKILYGHRVSILYIILYLCALEILPVLVLYKVLV